MRQERMHRSPSGGSIVKSAGPRRAVPTGPARARTESLVLDVVYVLGTIALFALFGLIAKAVEKL
jgi:hypothetical protein